jgi:gluconolactonase
MPILPNQVYRFDPKDGSIRAMADGFGRPNGIAFSADQKTFYIGDTGALVGNGTIDTTGPRTIYAFDVMGEGIQGGPFLSNRRLFAMPDNQAPDGIKSDTKGNVYAGCGDGVNVWSPGGTLLGRILLEGGIGNLGFGEAGELFAMGNQILWKINLDKAVVGAFAN